MDILIMTVIQIQRLIQNLMLKRTSFWINLNKNVIDYYWWLLFIIIVFYYWWWLLLMIIIDYYWWLFFYYWWLLVIIDDYYWSLLMIICYCNKTNFSSSIYKVIRPVLNFLIFFTIRFHKHQKAQSIYWGVFF